MSEIEVAQESLEHAAHEHASGAPYAKQAAIVIAALAACLALTETGAKDAQTAFLAHHIGASDTWAQYQGKGPVGNNCSNWQAKQPCCLNDLRKSNQSGYSRMTPKLGFARFVTL